jgi:hypothetical protein
MIPRNAAIVLPADSDSPAKITNNIPTDAIMIMATNISCVLLAVAGSVAELYCADDAPVSLDEPDVMLLAIAHPNNAEISGFQYS